MSLTVLNVGYPLAVVSEDTAGGAEQIVAILDAALVEHGHRSLVIAPAGSQCRGSLLPTPLPEGVLDERVQRLARWRHRDAITSALMRYPVDVVHLHGLDFLGYLPPTSVPVIVTMHLPPDWYPPEAFSPRPQTYLVCVSNSQALSCPESAPPHCVIENGICLPLPPRRNRRKSRPYVLSVGRICPEKGFHLAMDAASASGVRFLLAGAVYNYPSHRDYFSKEIEPRLNKSSRLLGPVGSARKHQLLADAKCLLVPSLVSETSSLVSMEAMACGTPVVAFPFGALRDIVRHGRTGFLVNSVEEMANAISMVDSIDPADCRAAAEARFSSTRMIEKYLALYRQVTAQRKVEQIEVAS